VKVTEKTEVKLDLKTVVSVIVITASFVGMYYTLKTDIQLAKILPKTEINRLEYDLKAEASELRLSLIEKALQAMYESCKDHDIELHKLDKSYNSNVDSKIRNLEKRISNNNKNKKR
tara:strand:- start:117 stop:467 length:351 start_codon:yes stop_codon:yes gene_type:complete